MTTKALKHLFIVAVSSAFFSCATRWPESLVINLSVGMTKQEVHTAMGVKPASSSVIAGKEFLLYHLGGNYWAGRNSTKHYVVLQNGRVKEWGDEYSIFKGSATLNVNPFKHSQAR